jgi:hypothetical protein
MKKATFTIALFLGIVSGFSQSLVTSNKAWSNLKMDYWNPNNLSTENLKFTIDTVINQQMKTSNIGPFMDSSEKILSKEYTINSMHLHLKIYFTTLIFN